MFEGFKSKVRGVLAKLGIIKTIKDLSDIKDIPVDGKTYQRIDEWKALYQGYYEPWHKVTYHTVDGERRRQMASLRAPKVITQEMASIIFNEKCEISLSNEELSENIMGVLDANNFTALFQEYLEYMFSLGGIVIKPYVKDDKLMLSYVTADCFIPVGWDNKGISEGVFVNEVRKKDKKYTHLEWHLWEGEEYVIKNELFEAESKSGDVGHKVPLNTLFEDLEEEVRIKEFKRSNFVYFKPSAGNNIDLNSPLGVSIYANAMDTLHTLDVAFDSFRQEFLLGKHRIIVPASAVRAVPDPNDGNKTVRYFDTNDEVYQGLAGGDPDDFKIDHDVVELRVEEHISAINCMLDLLSMQTGFSSGTFSFDGKSMKTATEVVSENSKTFRTKQSNENQIQSGITDLIECIIQTAELYNMFSAPEDWEVTIKFDDSIAEDREAEIDKQIKMVVGGIQSRKRAIMKAQGVSEEEAEEILKEIAQDQLETDVTRQEEEAEQRNFGEEE